MQFFQLGGIAPANKVGTDLFIEARFFAPVKGIYSSIAFQLSTFIYNYDVTNLNPGSIQAVTVKGKESIEGNINFCFSKRPHGRGFSIGYTYRSISIKSTFKTNTVIEVNGTNQAHLVVIGHNF